ncbi:hypothetical protein MJG53_017409 [Ovis ammon polii x Ovis aries]|uniref:Lymphocyte antigen 6 complex locus protein G5b n=2 Tax=Ovis TaxID=9935 RepID=A0AAD4XYN7_OVIAM|nr:hypothetical protein MG293_018898 [Ovis ammon polii]KAI4560780.1 hypothetical protein MJG53_017409 [Ovis ammon polii x Ovis aries]
MMKAHMLIGALVMVGFTVGKAPVSEVRTCHLCLLENPAVGCISGSEKCTISSSSPCMVISINHEYWYSAQCCQYDYCNSWYSPQLQSALPEPPDRSLALPLSQSQILWFYQTLNLSLPLPSFPAGEEPSEGLDPLAGPPVNLSLSIADLRSIYLFLNSSGLLTLPWAGP